MVNEKNDEVLKEVPGRSVRGLVTIGKAEAMTNVSGRFVYRKTTLLWPPQLTSTAQWCVGGASGRFQDKLDASIGGGNVIAGPIE